MVIPVDTTLDLTKAKNKRLEFSTAASSEDSNPTTGAKHIP
jgi:hypothetical protein